MTSECETTYGYRCLRKKMKETRPSPRPWAIIPGIRLFRQSATIVTTTSMDFVRSFLDSGAQPFPQQVAASQLNDEVVADSALMKGDVISHAFYGACRNGHTNVAELLLERGADVNAKGILGGTGLHWAAINGHKETVAFLLAHGADLTIRDVKFHSTAEGWAAEGGHDEIRDLLRGASTRP